MHCSSPQTSPVWLPFTRCSPAGLDFFPTGSQVLPSNLVQHRLVSFQNSFQKPIPVWISQGVITSFRHSSDVGPSRSSRWMSACLWISTYYRRKSASPWCDYGLSSIWNTSYPSFFPDFHDCRVISFTYFHSSLLWLKSFISSNFSPFLNLFLLKCYHQC